MAKASGHDDSYLVWMVFASLLVCGLSTILQVRRLGPVGAGAALPMFTAAFAIPFCITAVVDGGPATLTTLVIVSALIQLAISRWLFILRRFVTPTVGGTVMMILSITLASVVFGLLDAPWIGLPQSAPGLGLDFGLSFWTLLPGFLFLGLIISIQANGASIAMQRVSWRDDRAVDFRQVQGTLAGAGVSNLMAGLAGTVPNIVNPGIVSFTQITGVASRRVGYGIGGILILLAFVPKASGLLSTIPGPVMTGYLILITGTLFVDGARTVIQAEDNRQKVVVAGMCFWIGAAFQFNLVSLPDLGPVWGALFKSGITTGGFAAVAMILYLELTNPRRMRFQSRLHIDALPELNEFVAKSADVVAGTRL